jgi:hypothetical protein
MVPGLWLEPEVIGVHSPMAKSLPDEAFFRRDGARVTEAGRHHLDLRQGSAPVLWQVQGRRFVPARQELRRLWAQLPSGGPAHPEGGFDVRQRDDVDSVGAAPAARVMRAT